MESIINFSEISQDMDVIHIIGIGGIGMSGIAEIFCRLGYIVQGSDGRENQNIIRLRSLGAKVFIGHAPENVADATYISRSTAVTDDNPEVIAARESEKIVYSRAQILSALLSRNDVLAISGTHGKTTTTTMAASIFESCDMDPTALIGGIVNQYNSNAKLGEGNWTVVEADESDKTFIQIPYKIAIVTNISADHLNNYNDSFDELKSSFRQFIRQVPDDGFAVICKDCAENKTLIEHVQFDAKVITYTISSHSDADVTAHDIRKTELGTTFSVKFNPEEFPAKYQDGLQDLYLAMPGAHNLSNAVSIIAVAAKLDFDTDKLRSGLKNFQGVQRRFTLLGETNEIKFYDDYAHHPREIEATLKAAQEISFMSEKKKNVILIFQPHRYTRLRDLFDQFAEALQNCDHLMLLDTFAAGEPEDPDHNSRTLHAKISEYFPHAEHVADHSQIPNKIKEKAAPGDIVIFMGAGDITNIAHSTFEGF